MTTTDSGDKTPTTRDEPHGDRPELKAKTVTDDGQSYTAFYESEAGLESGEIIVMQGPVSVGEQ